MFPSPPFWSALALATGGEQAGFRIPISRVPARNPRLGQAVGDIALFNSQQYTYTVEIGIGSPPETFTMVLDTGSSDVWVVSCDCKDLDCQDVPRFSPKLSSTFANKSMPFNLEYLSGKADGQVASDTFSFGEFQVLFQTFATVNEVSNLGLTSSMTSGILGLCFPAVAAIPATAGATPLQNIMYNLSPSQRFFGLHLSRLTGSADPNGSFSFGAIDPELVPDPTQLANSSVIRTGHAYDYWKLPMHGFIINGSPMEISRSRVSGADTPIAVLDSGTTLMLGPSDDVAAFYDFFGEAARRDSAVGYQVRCTHAALVSVILGDVPCGYILHPADVAWSEGADGGWCTGGVQANDDVNAADWLLGDSFLRTAYVVHNYDPPTIGLLGLTDAEAALSEFRHERGPDVDNQGSDDDATADDEDEWNMPTGYVKRWEHHANSAVTRVFGAVAGGIGFVVGGVGAIGWRVWRGR